MPRSGVDEIAKELAEALKETLDHARWHAAQNGDDLDPSVDRRAEQAIEDFKFDLARRA
jgi:hypothetical protein